jgi:glutathione peroxidase
VISLYDVEVTTIAGRKQTLADYRGQVLLIVNVASRCGFTPQYAGLEALYQEHKDQGFSVLGFPCDQFGHQEPGSETEIQSFCSTNYNVSFPMFAKIEVNGPGTHPLYQILKAEKKGLLGTQSIKWNFTKFLVDRQGEVVNRYAATTTPDKIAGDLERLLG